MQRIFSFFYFKKATLHYSQYGNGEKVILLFHGFGLDHQLFYPLEELLKEEYTIFNFDIFFHGNSQWKYGSKPITVDFWKEMLGAFLSTNKINTFSLLGFSIGCKHVLPALVDYPSRIDKVILIASDGIKTSIWYKLSVHSYFSRIIFKQLVLKPGYFHSFIKAINFFGIAPKESIRFASSQLTSKEQRNRVYFTWVAYRKLKLNPQKIIDAINEHQIPVEIYLGKHDRIISYEKLNHFITHLKTVKVELLEAGHSNLVSEVVKKLKKERRP